MQCIKFFRVVTRLSEYVSRRTFHFQPRSMRETVSLMVPIVDTENPMYRPDISSSAYLRRIRQTRPSRYSNSFTLKLSRSEAFLSSDDISCLEDTFLFKQKQKVQHVLTDALLPPSTRRKRVDVPKYVYHHSKRQKLFMFEGSALKRRFHVPFDTVSSFDSSGSAFGNVINEQPLRPFPMSNTQLSPHIVVQPHRDLHSHPITTETPKSLSHLLSSLNRQLPGILHQFSKFDRITSQNIVDLLGAEGCLGKRVLEYFRSFHVERIDLSASFCSAAGLNKEKPCVVLEIFSAPHSFTYLKALNLNNVVLDDFDLTFIHHLGSLTTLWLNSTTIGLEAIGHLTALKKHLIELHVEDNPRITDDCIPIICLFSSLSVLRLHGTRIEMPGLRRLAISVHIAAREIDIGIPSDCETYLNNLHAEYQLYPVLPLITDPNICTSLSLTALRANLAAHAVFNPSISLSGTKLELVKRLSEILERREGDRVVKKVVWGYENEDETSVDEAEKEEW